MAIRKAERVKAGPEGSRKRYEQVAETLLESIRTGKLPVGATVPGELELVTQFGVSRHTVREALRRLEGLGLIGRHQGIGTVVKAREPQQSYVQSVRSPEELRPVLERAVAGKEPVIIEVPIGEVPSPWGFIQFPKIRG